ncbi:MAG: tail fiber domain-containing protein [Thiobacillaceae bacterium]
MKSQQGFKYNALWLSILAGLGGISQAHARTDNQAYAELIVQFGEKIAPFLQLGGRFANLNNSGDPNGAGAGLLIGLGGIQSVKLTGFTGDRCTQGEAGVGWNFQDNALLFTGDVQGDHLTGGVDYSLGRTGLSPYLGVNTIDCYDRETPAAAPVSSSTGGSTGYGGYTSDRRLKKDVVYLTTLATGIKLYSFRYVWSDAIYVGVMAQDLLSTATHGNAVTLTKHNYYVVDYKALGLRMITLREWLQSPENIFCTPDRAEAKALA